MFPESLAGRKYLFTMHPLTFSEFTVFHSESISFYEKWSDKERYKSRFQAEKIKPLYTEYLKYGAFPQVSLVDSSEKNVRPFRIYLLLILIKR